MRAGSRIAEHGCRRATQTNALIGAAQQQNATVRTDVAALEIGLDDAPAKPPQIHRPIGTLWHRQSSVEIGVRYQCQRAPARGCRPSTGEISGLELQELGEVAAWHSLGILSSMLQMRGSQVIIIRGCCAVV